MAQPGQRVRRLHREVKELSTMTIDEMAPIIALCPMDDCMDTWSCLFDGPPGTPYEGGSFFLSLTVPGDYPLQAPKAQFTTPVMHPNISRKGEISLDLLKSQWSPHLTLFKLCMSIISLLPDPNWTSMVNPCLRVLYQQSSDLYASAVSRFTVKYASEVPPPPSDNPLHNRGVRLSSSLIRQLRSDCSHLTVHEVVQEKILPFARQADKPFVECLREVDPDSVGPATHFVSYTWSHNFGKLMNQLESTAKESFFWIDIFAVNQNSPSGDLVLIDDLLGELLETVFVVDADFKALTRAWCLWEVTVSITSGAYIKAIGTPVPKLVAEGVSFRKSEATVEEDRERIVRSIAHKRVDVDSIFQNFLTSRGMEQDYRFASGLQL